MKQDGEEETALNVSARMTAIIMDSVRSMACADASEDGRDPLAVSPIAPRNVMIVVIAWSPVSATALNLGMGLLARNNAACTLVPPSVTDEDNVLRASASVKLAGWDKTAVSPTALLVVPMRAHAPSLEFASAMRTSTVHDANSSSAPTTAQPMAHAITSTNHVIALLAT